MFFSHACENRGSYMYIQAIAGSPHIYKFKQSREAYVFYPGSTCSAFISKNQVEKKIHADLHVGDVIRFGQSSRLCIFQGPTDSMPPIIRDARIREELLDRAASLQRARYEASLSEGISWGMGEDGIEEAEVYATFY